MKRKWLRYFLFLWAGLVLPARAQLQFTNVSNVNLTNLFGITCGGASNSIAGGSNYVFVAVGANSSVVTWTLTNPVSNANQNTNWIQKQVSGASGLYAAAFGGNQFLVTGDGNVVFSSTDAVNWTSNGMMFANSARAQGMAFNNGTFVAVASAPEIAWSTNATATPWGSATITKLSFADSFRGVTAFNLSSNSSNFAACGILGRLATSSDGGRNWATNYGHIGQPDLFGITSDNRQTLVCVGANGAILTFTNGGTFWASSTNGTNSLNAVSFVGTNYLGTNNGFIAVGANGSVLTSVEGTNWTTINTNANYPTLKANNNNLNGVFFATSGQFKGVGVLVGDRGTIIIAGTPPPPPANPVGATNCASYPGSADNNPLSVSLVTNADYPPGAVTVDWYDASTNGNRVATSTTDYTPTNNPDMIGSNVPTTYTYYAEERDLRTGFTSTIRTNVTLTIYPRPTATLTSVDETRCNYGLAYTITATLTGLTNWNVTWWDGAVSNYTASYGNDGTAVRVVYPTNVLTDLPTNYQYWIAGVTNINGCVNCGGGCTNWAGDVTGTNTVTVNPRPTAKLTSVDETNCNYGLPYTITATLTGLTNWNVTWWDGAVSNYTASYGTDGTAVRVVVYPTNVAATSYQHWIAGVTNINGCVNCGGGCTNWAGDVTGTNTVTVVPCTNQITSITLSGTNAFISWSGNYVLESATNLTPPVMWTPVFTQAVVGPYTWTNSTVPPPPDKFFRLYAPTN
jgi:hypothetical protein